MQSRYLAGVVAAGLALGCSASLDSPPGGPPSPTTATPEARAQTAPMPHGGDAADDPAVWIHPQDPASSLILGTDKSGGLHAYNLDGSAHQLVSDGARPNNVDVLYGFSLSGRAVDLAVASTRPAQGVAGLKLWAIDPATRLMSDVTAGGTLSTFGGADPYGACAYHSARTGRFYVFVTDGNGHVEQYELQDGGGSTVTGTRVRALGVSSTAEGCVADAELGVLYLAEEDVGIWKFGAEPDAGGVGKLVARVGVDGLTAQVEGLAIYYAAQGRGYLIASSQGNSTFMVYERAGENRYVLTIDPRGSSIDDVSDTDGIDVTSCPTSRDFARGMFIAQDGANGSGNQNFKLYGWEDIAGTSLLMDPTCRPRGQARLR